MDWQVLLEYLLKASHKDFIIIAIVFSVPIVYTVLEQKVSSGKYKLVGTIFVSLISLVLAILSFFVLTFWAVVLFPQEEAPEM
jgi:uncharacterized membrane protein